jgi:gluconokinase
MMLLKTMILILMGVTGSGKTTIGKLLAAETGWQFAEGDDFHSEANRQKMHQGIPLTDEDRAPWLASMHDLLLSWYQSGTSGILACSALKQKYRDALIDQIPPLSFRFVWLDVPREDLERRLHNRKGHYMNPNLLQSQLDTLEIPEDALRIAEEEDPRRVVQRILDQLLVQEGKPSVPDGLD